MKRGLFLDLDGTLAATLPMLREAYLSFLADFEAIGCEAEFQALNGPPLTVIVQRLQAAHALPGPPETLLRRYQERLAAVHGQAEPAPGARGVLERAGTQGWTVAVVSSNTGASTRAWLARTGLDGLVATVVGGDEVLHGKPEPEPYLRALALTGCEAARSLAIEDSPQGAAAAIAAGLNTWLVGPAPAEALTPAAAARERHPLFCGRLPDFQAVASLL